MKNLFEKIRNQYDNIAKVFLFIVSIAILVMVYPRERKFKYEYQKGKPWLYQDLIAPFDFAILKEKGVVENERQEVADELKPFFNYDKTIFPAQKEWFIEQFDKSWKGRYGMDDLFIPQRLTNRSFGIGLLDSIYSAGIIELNQAIEDKPEDFRLIVLRENVATEEELSQLYTLQKAYDKILGSLSDQEDLDIDLLSTLLTNALKHNVFFNEEKTKSELGSRLNDISLTKGMVQKGERIIGKGDLITIAKYRILQSLKVNYETRNITRSAYLDIMVGQILLVSIAMLVLIFFMALFRRDISSSNKKLVLVLSMIVFMVVITGLVVKYQVDYLYLVPLCIVPIVIRAFFDARLALYVHLITVILTGFLVPDSFMFVFLQLIAGIIAIMSIYNLERRSQFFLTTVWIFLAYSAIYFGRSLIEEGDITGIDPMNFLLFAGSAILTLFAYPMIFVIEKVFGMITDITLIELANTNNKLLREMAQKAPGTFQHSLQVSNLSEEVIYNIGGNALLVRTGALYHDIGKMDMPVYFIENQTTGMNPHDELTPEESARIIVSHVIKGVEKAKKHKLPEEIIDFIRTHHGTRKTGYFYALQKNEFPEEEIDERVFTYPGPIPFSRETSVLMMADSVEAASRSLKKPDEQKISDLVENIINKQVESGQFVNSDITFRDITEVKKILKRMLKNIYHVRIAYPE